MNNIEINNFNDILPFNVDNHNIKLLLNEYILSK